jgi:hypothetical protein
MAVVLQFNFSLYFQWSAPEASQRYSDNATLHFALSYRASTLWRNVIASIIYRSEHVGGVNASHIYRSKLIDQHYRFNYLSFLLVITFPYLDLLFNFSHFSEKEISNFFDEQTFNNV